MHNCRWTARPHEVPPGGHPFGLWNPWAAVLGWDVQRRGSGRERTFGGDLRSPEASGRAEGYGGRPSASRGTRSASTAFPLTGHAPWGIARQGRRRAFMLDWGGPDAELGCSCVRAPPGLLEVERRVRI
jgi:hypothetical protein